MGSLPRSLCAVALAMFGAAMLACSRRTPPAETADSMPGMADMPGMSMASPKEVTLSPAQIQHGGIRWAPAAVSRASGIGAGSGPLPGQIVPNEDRTARLGAPASGRVLTVRVNQGDRVRSGQALVTLRSPEAALAQSDLAKANAAVASQRAQAAYAASARQRAERLLALKAIPRQDYERAIADDELARAELAQAEAELGRARSTAEALGAVGTTSGELALRASLNGVVLDRTAVPGTVVEAGAPLVVITDPSSLWVTLNAPESATGSLRIGQSLRFTVPAFPSDTFTARVSAVGAGLDPDTRTVFARAVIANRGGRLKPAMLASVLLPGSAATPGGEVVVLPADAVQLLDSATVVFVVHPQAGGSVRVMPRPVETGPRSGSQIPITRGIVPGELVVVSGAFSVKAEFKRPSTHKMEM